MPSVTAAGKQVVALRGDQKYNHQTIKANQSELAPGGLLHFDSGPLSSPLAHTRILNSVELSGTFNNLSATATDFIKCASLFQTLSVFNVWLNSTLVFSLSQSSTDANPWYAFRRAYVDGSGSVEELQSAYWYDDIDINPTSSDLVSEINGAGGANPTTRAFTHTTRHVLSDLFHNLPIKISNGQKCIESVRFEIGWPASLGLMGQRRVTYDMTAPATIDNSFKVTDLRVKLIYIDSPAGATPAPLPSLSLLYPRTVVKRYPGALSSSATFNVNLHVDFPSLQQIERVYFWFVSSAAGDTATNLDPVGARYLAMGALSGISIRENSSEIDTWTKKELLKHMERAQTYKQSHGLVPPPNSNFVTDSSGGYFFDMSTYHRKLLVRRGYDSTKLISGRSNALSTIELELQTEDQSAYATTDLVVQLVSEGHATLNTSNGLIVVDYRAG